MHDNLTNSRGNSRLANQQINNDNMKMYNATQRQQPIGAQSPPSMIQRDMKPSMYEKTEPNQIQAGKHFMQDAIERKIEKFSSQNASRRVNTSSKFRNNAHSIGNSLQGISNQPGQPGAPVFSPGIQQKKKFSVPSADFQDVHDTGHYLQAQANQYSKKQAAKNAGIKFDIDKEIQFLESSDPKLNNRNMT